MPILTTAIVLAVGLLGPLSSIAAEDRPPRVVTTSDLGEEAAVNLSFCRVWFGLRDAALIENATVVLSYDDLQGEILLTEGEPRCAGRHSRDHAGFAIDVEERTVSTTFLDRDPAPDGCGPPPSPQEIRYLEEARAYCYFAADAGHSPSLDDFSATVTSATTKEGTAIEPLPQGRIFRVHCMGVPTSSTSTITSTTCTTSTTLVPTTACGDPTGDGEITAADALYVLQTAVGLRTCPRKTCDVFGDNGVSASDALYILRVAVGLIDPATVECAA